MRRGPGPIEAPTFGEQRSTRWWRALTIPADIARLKEEIHQLAIKIIADLQAAVEILKKRRK